MTVPSLTPEQLLEAADTVGLSLTDADVSSYLGLMKPYLDAYNLVDAMPDNLPVVKYPRTPGVFPSPAENPRNAWYVKTSIKGAASGKLAGKKVAIKDNVMVAGVPMMNGNSILEGYVPDVDATIVTRILDAGGEIAGKTHCENYCISGGSHTGAKGAVHNPYKMGYSAGGSSSGSGVTVALGEADMAIGGDQGGSIRMPSSWCGIVGMKPTYGRVSRFGIIAFGSMFQAGPDGPSVTLVDGAVMQRGSYPSRDELAKWTAGVEQAPSIVTEQVAELVAIGSAIASNCEPCLTFHVNRARDELVGLRVELRERFIHLLVVCLHAQHQARRHAFAIGVGGEKRGRDGGDLHILH